MLHYLKGGKSVHKITMNKIICLAIMMLFMASANTISAQSKDGQLGTTNSTEDFDPLVDINVTVTIKEIRAFDVIDKFTDPDFYVKVFINDNEYDSDIWYNTKYVDDPSWSVTCNVPDDEELVDIKIQLWDWNLGKDKICDISRSDQTDERINDSYAHLFYDIAYGMWYGDDYSYYEPTMFDPSGYGRLNGCDDNSIYQQDRDCELVFDITQTDYDGDGMPYWAEVNYYGTDPEVNDTGTDYDNDSVPTEWECKWGYDPMEWDDHANLDPDQDGLDNVEEYLTSQWGSDPFRKDIFLELDQMEIGPNGEGHFVPEQSKQLLKDAFGKHNIVLHIDDGCMGGGEIIPFDDNVTTEEMQNIYWNYFLHGDPDNWRQGTFHYGLILYHAARYPGFVWWGGEDPVLDSFQISTDHHDAIAKENPFYLFLRYKSFNPDEKRAIIYAGAMMHETGHTLGIFSGNTPGCDDQVGKYIWQKDWWKWGPYKSCMNYRYVYALVDYSDGSRGKNDFDDWGRIDLTFFQRDLWWLNSTQKSFLIV